MDNPVWVLNKSMAHSFSESDSPVLKDGISTSWDTAADHIHIFFRSKNVNYSRILSRHGKIIPINAHISTGNGSFGITTRQFQQQVWQSHPEISWNPPEQMLSPQYWLIFRNVITNQAIKWWTYKFYS